MGNEYYRSHESHRAASENGTLALFLALLHSVLNQVSSQSTEAHTSKSIIPVEQGRNPRQTKQATNHAVFSSRIRLSHPPFWHPPSVATEVF